jgi:branched-subunit amino acid transport protein AzlD
MASTSTESRWRLSSPGNRVMWAVIAAFVLWLIAQSVVLSLVIGVVVFLVLTAVVSTRRRS